MRAFEFLSEDTVDSIIPDLKKLGYDNFKKMSGKRVAVLVPQNQRKKTLNDILSRLPNSTYDSSTNISSLGHVVYNGAVIIVKPSGKQGSESAGLKNEQHLINKINEFVQTVGPLDITFKGSNGVDVTALGVTQAVGAGKNTADRRKSDLNLLAGDSLLPISIKKRDSAYWESADSYFGTQADEIVADLEKQGKVSLTEIGQRQDGVPVVKIQPEVAIETTDKQSTDFVFGNDILAGNGAVIKETFEDEHYILKDNKLTVTCDLVIKEPKDIPDDLKVYILIRNDKTRMRGDKAYPGLRIIASYANRIRNALILDTNLNPKS